VTSSCSASTAYTAGRFVAGTATSTTFDIAPAKCTELAYAFETSGSTLGAYYRLRVVSASTTQAFAAYSNYPTLRIETARTLAYSKEARGLSTTTPQNAVASTYPSIAIGTDGFPVISYIGTSGFLEVAHCTDITCSGRTIAAQNSVTSDYTSLAIGTDGFPVISYQNSGTGFLEVAHCTNIACTGRSINVQNAVASLYTSLAIGTDGFPVISYQNNSSGRLEVAHCTDIACSGRTIAAQNNVSSLYISISIGTDGYPVISYRNNSTTFLEVAHCTDIACSGRTIAAQNAVDSYYTSISIGTDGYPIIGYLNNDFTRLEVVHCTNIACSGRSITVQNGVTSEYISFAIGTDGFPVISYQNSGTGFLEVAHCTDITCTGRSIGVQNAVSSLYTSISIGIDGYPIISYRNNTSTFLETVKCSNIACVGAASSTANLPNTSTSLATYLDDAGYGNVATSDNLYDSLTSATSSRLAYNFKKASTTNTDQITVTWEGQVSVSTTTSLQIFNYVSGLWTNLETNASPTGGSDFTLTGTQSTSLSEYYDGSNIVTARAVTGTTTKTTTLKTDRIDVTFSTPISLTLGASTNSFGSLTPGNYKIATTTLNVTTNNVTGYSVSIYGNNQGSGGASTTLYLSPTTYTTNIADQTEWVPGAATTSAGNAVVRASLDGTQQVLAFRVMSASGSVPFLSTAWWGASDADGTAKWAGVASSTVSRQIGNSSAAAPSGVLSTVQYYLDTPINQIQGNYTGDITFTAVTNP
jgi:hypothetical protein